VVKRIEVLSVADVTRLLRATAASSVVHPLSSTYTAVVTTDRAYSSPSVEIYQQLGTLVNFISRIYSTYIFILNRASRSINYFFSFIDL
jgi:hypothetical protein